MKRLVWLVAGLICSSGLIGCATGTPTSPTTAPAVATAAPDPTLANTVAPAPTETALSAPPAATAVADTTPAAVGKSVLPAVASVWNTTIGPDNMTGECSKGSVLPVYGLVQVTPVNGIDGTFDVIEWKNQEPKPYTLKQIEPNTFSYAGPTSIDDGTVTMTVTFENETTFKMVRQFVSRADPGCLHSHDYAGEFKWTR